MLYSVLSDVAPSVMLLQVESLTLSDDRFGHGD